MENLVEYPSKIPKNLDMQLSVLFADLEFMQKTIENYTGKKQSVFGKNKVYKDLWAIRNNKLKSILNSLGIHEHSLSHIVEYADMFGDNTYSGYMLITNVLTNEIKKERISEYKNVPAYLYLHIGLLLEELLGKSFNSSIHLENSSRVNPPFKLNKTFRLTFLDLMEDILHKSLNENIEIPKKDFLELYIDSVKITFKVGSENFIGEFIIEPEKSHKDDFKTDLFKFNCIQYKNTNLDFLL